MTNKKTLPAEAIRQVRPQILCVDFDATICDNLPGHAWAASAEYGRIKPYAAEVINRLYDEGNYIIIWTARYLPADIKDARIFLEKHGVKYHKINEPCEFLAYKSLPKVFCDTQIDDNCLLNIDWRFIPYYVELRKAAAGLTPGAKEIITAEMVESFFYRTVGHIKRVIAFCDKFSKKRGLSIDLDVELMDRAMKHDSSKFDEDLIIQYVVMTEQFRARRDRQVAFAGRNMSGITDKVAEHYARSPHHPEYWKDVKDMDWASLIEMCADLCAMSAELGSNDPLEYFLGSLTGFSWSKDQIDTVRKTIETMWSMEEK